MGRVARPPADNEKASVYWEDTWDARGKRFKANEVSCAHRTEAFGTIFVVTNLDNGKTDQVPGAGPRSLYPRPGAGLLTGCGTPDRLRRIVPGQRPARRLRMSAL